jgi:3-methyladenine DNA glycosylase AlkC
MAALKHQVDAALGRRLAAELVAAWPAFPRRRFMSGLAVALEPLELLARIGELADRLSRALPAEFPAASTILWRCLDSPSFTGWMTVPCSTFVSYRGIDDPELALPLLAGLTPRWSSEWAIRPFIERHPALTYDHLRRWLADDDEHVRRLVSEGTRPRLPWAPQLRSLVADPAPNLPLLDALAGDSSRYVRRSVANHLNDIAKDHPALALDLARRWLSRDGAAWTARHGIRTLIKRGDPQALELAAARLQARAPSARARPARDAEARARLRPRLDPPHPSRPARDRHPGQRPRPRHDRRRDHARRYVTLRSRRSASVRTLSSECSTVRSQDGATMSAQMPPSAHRSVPSSPRYSNAVPVPLARSS